MTFAFFFESVGGGEWLVLLAVILVVVGPKNLPSAARKIGQVMSQLRRAADEFKRQLMTMDQEVRSTVETVKQDYMNVGQDVQDTVAGTDGASDADPSADAASSDPASEDRAMWESYGREYDPDGIYGYGTEGGVPSDPAEAAAEGTGADVAAAEPSVLPAAEAESPKTEVPS